MDRFPYRRLWVAGLLIALSFGALAVTCRGESGGEEPTVQGTESSGASSGSDPKEGSDKQKAAASASDLPGDVEPGSRDPESPGPEGAGIFFLAGLKGYLEPCGCTADVMLGGAERIAGYAQASRDLYAGTLVLDGGDAFFETKEIDEHLVPQEKAKADVIVELLRAFGTRAMVPGERDFALGADFYRKKVDELDVTLLGANISIGGDELEGATVLEVGDWSVALVGAVQPKLYEGLEGVETTEAAPAVERALESIEGENPDATILVVHGGLKAAKELLKAEDRIDFAVVGHDPRETDQVDRVGGGYTLEAYDQGRYVGVLKLFGSEHSDPFENARTGSRSELEQIDRQIEHVEQSIEKLPPAPPGEGPPILKRLRKRLEKLQERREEIRHADLEISEERRSFLYRPVPMKPGYPIDTSIRSQRTAYNQRLEKLTRQIDREIPEVPEGNATYVGTNQCKKCHGDAHNFWKGTLHAKAMETLRERNKAWDEKCVRCHVVGYDQPGGSIVGKLKYEAKVGGSTLTKDLRNVGCEACHGPGSKHRGKPVSPDGSPQHIESGSGRDVCKDCHVEEHSPRFRYETYVREITGEGHPLGGTEK